MAACIVIAVNHAGLVLSESDFLHCHSHCGDAKKTAIQRLTHPSATKLDADLWFCTNELLRVCVDMQVVCLVCDTNLYNPISEHTQMWHFPSLPSLSLAGLKGHWVTAKPAAICGNVSTGTDLYKVSPISAFRRLIAMSIFRLIPPGFLCGHTPYLGLTFDYLYSKGSPEIQGCVGSAKNSLKQLLDH